ncbi:MAG: ABC transporter substrate-binding protein [Ilumatobacteraceae bacterium]|nr:ABC transporter substrate-binding protein [Ilumatobacteraceae bacterium]
MKARTLTAIAVGLALTAAGCGSDDDPGSTSPTNSESTAAPAAAPESTEAPDSTVGSAESTDAAPEATDTVETAAFPVTIEHKFGETTIPAEPESIVSIGFGEHDGLLSLGVTPIGVRDWYGDQPFATWPWAQEALGDAKPEVLASTELNFEQIAALQPDLIVGLSSGMSESDYETLAAIAPTVAQPGDYPDYGTPFDEAMLITGRAVGKEAEAQQIVDDTEAAFAEVRKMYPEFEGQTAAVAFAFEDLPGAYASSDVRAEVMSRFGFVTPPEFDELAGDSFFFSVSEEQLSTLDQDVIVWLASSEAEYEALRGLALRPTLVANAEGREVVADPLLMGAFSHSSPLSLQFVIEELVPELVLAVDGDPSTQVPSMLVLDSAGADLGEDDQAAADAWSAVFDSTVAFDGKAEYLESADELRGTIDSYQGVGDSLGGIRLDPVGVVVTDEQAIVTYDVYFGENAAYTALEGEMSLVDGTWTVSRAEFCGFMASARNPCP